MVPDAHHQVASDDYQFKISVLTDLASLKTWAEGITDQFAKLNGSVAEHSKRLVEVDKYVAQRQIGCPLVMELKSDVDSIMTTRKTDVEWWARLNRPITLLILLVFVLVLLHAKQMLDIIKGAL